MSLDPNANKSSPAANAPAVPPDTLLHDLLQQMAGYRDAAKQLTHLAEQVRDNAERDIQAHKIETAQTLAVMTGKLEELSDSNADLARRLEHATQQSAIAIQSHGNTARQFEGVRQDHDDLASKHAELQKEVEKLKPVP